MRKSPLGFSYPSQYQIAGEHFANLAMDELKTRKPKFVVVNLYNNLGMVTYGKIRKDISRYFSLGNEDGPVFGGEGSREEIYILENYEPVLKNDLAVVMRRRSEPITVGGRKKEIYKWQPDGRVNKTFDQKISWVLMFENPILASDISIEFKLDGNILARHLTRYYLYFYALSEESSSNEIYATRILARRIWQTAKIEFNEPQKVSGLKIEIGEDTGLIWWLKPQNLSIKKVSFYEYF